jgi:hypothetical protein
MQIGPLIPLIMLAIGAVAIYGLDRLVRWLQRPGWLDLRQETVRGGAGRAILGLEEFIDPRVEHVIETQNREQIPESEETGEGDPDHASIVADLAASLRDTPIDPNSVRRHLADALRAGMDWRSLYDDAVRSELVARPYRAPLLPPIARVAPREDA